MVDHKNDKWVFYPFKIKIALYLMDVYKWGWDGHNLFDIPVTCIPCKMAFQDGKKSIDVD